MLMDSGHVHQVKDLSFRGRQGWISEDIDKDLYKDVQYDLVFFLLCPLGGDQAESYLGQDSSDDNQSGTHGPSLTSDAPFLPDYQDEGECHLPGFWVDHAALLLFVLVFLPFVMLNHVNFSGFSVLVIASLQKTTICFIVVLILLGNSILVKLMYLGKH